MTLTPTQGQHLKDLARLRRVRDRIDREYAEPLDVEALAAARTCRRATPNLDGVFEKLQGSDAEVVQEPIDQPYGIRDCAFRDPAGNLLRIQELS